MRLFIAIQLSDELKKTITSSMHEMKKQGIRGSYVPTQNLHLTIAFIGETADSGAVKDALRTIKVKPFRLSLSEMGTFGDLLWVGMKGNQGLSGAVKAVRESLDAAGISYDHKKFVPHITIIRKMAGKWQSIPAPKGEMIAEKISLMKSERIDGKMKYTEIFAVDGKGSSGR